MHLEQELDVGCFLSSPRHAHHFAVSVSARAKIHSRIEELYQTGRVAGKTPIVNIQSNPGLVELHDGNATVVAWLVYAERQKLAPSLGMLRSMVDELVVLHQRRHAGGEVWHPYVPIEVASAGQLEQVLDAEQHRATCRAVTTKGEPVLFDNREYFSGEDSALPLRQVAQAFTANALPL